jgi:hypothetical protein
MLFCPRYRGNVKVGNVKKESNTPAYSNHTYFPSQSSRKIGPSTNSSNLAFAQTLADRSPRRLLTSQGTLLLALWRLAATTPLAAFVDDSPATTTLEVGEGPSGQILMCLFWVAKMGMVVLVYFKEG